MKKRIIVGNWKMNPETEKEAVGWFGSIAKGVNRIKKTEIVVCPPFIYLPKLKNISKKLHLGAQDAFYGDVGPFTGEISVEMLYNLGVRHIILGHSERRTLGEKDEHINKKIKSVLASGITPILCVGEWERDLKHQYFNLVRSQVEECLKGVSKTFFSKIIIAYEPVWALSSTIGRRDATPEDAKEMAIFIRKILSEISTPEIAREVRIIYGGSVNERDVEGFLVRGGVDGALPGKASMDPKKFIEIINITEKIK